MTYTLSTLLSFEEFWSQYGGDPRYELIDGELWDTEPAGPHESTSGKLAGRLFTEILRLNLKWTIPKSGLAFIRKPKQPTFTVCQLVNGEYQQQQYRLGQAIASPLLPEINLSLNDIMP